MISQDLELAKSLLLQGHTCALARNGQAVFSDERGVTPLLQWLSGNPSFAGYSAADKVVGKAAAFLYVLLGVKEVYANVVSEAAALVFQTHGISLSYAKQAPAIRNRTNTGFCPMEQAVWHIDDPHAALQAIIEQKNRLQNNR